MCLKYSLVVCQFRNGNGESCAILFHKKSYRFFFWLTVNDLMLNTMSVIVFIGTFHEFASIFLAYDIFHNFIFNHFVIDNILLVVDATKVYG